MSGATGAPRTVGTAGHIDHGKTALVRALTGVDTDRLPEERARGISIVLGFAPLDLGDGLPVSVVDVPGHERFVRTMVAGAAGIDVALLCVACDDGVMPQTREHLAVLDLLGVRRGVVALTKRDLVDEEGEALAALDVADALVGHPLADAPVVPVSARTGAGIPALRAALRAAVATVAPRRAEGRARLPVDRAFSLRGIGTVATGTLWSGTLRVGDRVTVAPSGEEARIRSLESHGVPVDEARAGGRVAAALVGVEARGLGRGAALVGGPAPRASYRLDVALRAAPHAEIPDGAHVEVLHGTAAVPARVVRLAGGDDERAGGLAQLRLARPLAALRGDRLVLRGLAPPATVAGGTVLDPAPVRHRGGPARAARLRARRDGDAADVVRACLADGPARPADLVAGGLLEPGEEAAAAAALVRSGDAVALPGGGLVLADAYARLAEEVRRRLEERAVAAPLDPVLSPGTLLPARGREGLVARLAADGVLVPEPGGVRLAGTSADRRAAGDAVVAALAAAPFAPPRAEAAAAAAGATGRAARTLLAELERDGRIVGLGGGLAVTAEAYDAAVALVRRACEDAGSVTLAGLRDATGTSRRYAQALLERMDADGITRRTGDVRVLAPPRPSARARSDA